MYPIEFLWRAVRRFPDRIAIVAPEGETAFAELARRVEARAVTLSQFPSLGDGFVCVGADNSVEHLVSILSVLAAGKVWVPLNPLSGDPELRRIIAFVEPDLVLVDEDMRARIRDGDWPTRLFSELKDLEGSPPMGPRSLLGVALDRTQGLKFTGGTTGRPKGVMQPLRAWNTNIATQMQALRLGPEDRYLVAAPLTHGTSTYMLPVLGSGGGIIFPEDRKPAALLDAAERDGASLLFAPPTLVLGLVAEQTHAARMLQGLRYIIYGGGPMRPKQIREAQGCLGPVLCTTYGQTEAPQIATFLPPEEMVDPVLASVGRPTFLTQIGIFNEAGQAMPAGAQGEIAIRGDLVMTGYFKAPEETARTLKNGWLFTGDAGVVDERGYVFIRDRIRDLIITGGFNVYPSDVEVVLAAHPAVADCSVVGIQDEKWGEAVHAAIEVRPGATVEMDALKAMIRRELGPVKTPKAIHIFDSLPRSPVGKVLKPAIRHEISCRWASEMEEIQHDD
ncbi:MAG: class I adenylate-forming enzyme family protein [Steroidobacteraceae bacterium]